jgi:hypothetical protein
MPKTTNRPRSMNIAIPKEIVLAVLEEGGNNLGSGNMQPPRVSDRQFHRRIVVPCCRSQADLRQAPMTGDGSFVENVGAR